MRKHYEIYRKEVAGFANEKPLEEQSKEMLIDFIYSLYAHIDRLEIERNTMRNTMNKFVAKDHPEVLKSILVELGECN